MFTGIVEEVGTLAELEGGAAGSRLRIRCRKVVEGIREGDSIAVNGVCLTAVDPRADSFGADVSPETLRRSSLGALPTGTHVNLERALQPSGRLGGHIMQGHVDGAGELVSLDQLGDGNWWLRVAVSEEVERYAVFKGSIGIDGVSLTVAALDSGIVSVAVIPHTYQNTNLKFLQPGSAVNVESDILAKYVEKLLARLEHPSGKLTMDRLEELGY